MEKISTGILRDIVKDRERMGESTISVSELLARLQLTPIVDPGELSRLRKLEAVARKIVSDHPRWILRGPDYDDAEALRQLVAGAAAFAFVEPSELSRLREIEALARKIVSTPLWELRGAGTGDAEELRRLVAGDTD